jgi:ribonuclease P protein component
LKRYGGGSPHIAVVVSKKTARRASARNRIRRRVYALLARLIKPDTGTVVVFPKAEALRAPADEMVAELAEALLR